MTAYNKIINNPPLSKNPLVGVKPNKYIQLNAVQNFILLQFVLSFGPFCQYFRFVNLKTTTVYENASLQNATS